MSFWPSGTFSKIADWFSISGALISLVSLGLTAYLTVTATRVRRDFQDKVLLPVYLNALQIHCQNMKLILEQMTDNVLIFAELGRIEGNLMSLRKEFRNKEERDSVDNVLEAVSVYRQTKTSKNLSVLNSRTNSLTTQLENKVRGLQWIN